MLETARAFFSVIVGTIIRNGVILLGGWLAAHGLLLGTQVTQWAEVTGAAVVAIIWGVVVHYHNRIKFLTALDSPPGVSEAHIEEKIKNGLGATLTGGQV
jgi:hypothetical protein